MAEPSSDEPPTSKAEFLAMQRRQREATLNRRRKIEVAAKSSNAPPPPPPKLRWGIEAVLATDKGVNVLREFCVSELSEENMNFLLDARAWVAEYNLLEPEVRTRSAKKLIDLYLASGASMEVSLPAGLEGDFMGDVSTYNPSMFDRAMGAARKTLFFDIFPRFEESEEGIKLRKEMDDAAPPPSGALTYTPAFSVQKAPPPPPPPQQQPKPTPEPVSTDKKAATAAATTAAAAAAATAAAAASAGGGGGGKRASVAPWVEDDAAILLAARIHAAGPRSVVSMLRGEQRSFFPSVHAPGVRPPRPLGRIWLSASSGAAPPIASVEYTHAIHRACRTADSTYRAGYLLLLVALADGGLHVGLSNAAQSPSGLAAIGASDFIAALAPQGAVAIGGLLAILLTLPPLVLRPRVVVRFPILLEGVCMLLLAAPLIAASALSAVRASEPLYSTPFFPPFTVDYHARAVAYAAAALALIPVCVHHTVLSASCGALLLCGGIAEGFVLWGVRQTGPMALPVHLDPWASPILHALSLLACGLVGGRLAYLRESGMIRERLLQHELRLGAQHAARLLADLTMPLPPRENAYDVPRALSTLREAATPLSAVDAAKAKAHAEKRAAENPQLGMAGGKSVVDLDHDSMAAVSEGGLRAAMSATALSGLPSCRHLERVGVVCCRIHGCDAGMARATAVFEALNRLSDICDAAAKRQKGWYKIEARGPLLVYAYGALTSPSAAAEEEQPQDAAGARLADADADVAARGCALARAMLAGVLASKDAAAQHDRWGATSAQFGGSDASSTMGGFEPRLSIGIGVGPALCGLLRPSSGAGGVRHVLVSDALEAARTSALHRAPDRAYVDARLHGLLETDTAKERISKIASSSRGNGAAPNVVTAAAAKPIWAKVEASLPSALEAGEMPIWSTGHELISALRSSESLASPRQPARLTINGARPSRLLPGGRTSSSSSALRQSSGGSLRMSASSADGRQSSMRQSSMRASRWKPAVQMPPEVQAKFTELVQKGHLKAAAELVATFEEMSRVQEEEGQEEDNSGDKWEEEGSVLTTPPPSPAPPSSPRGPPLQRPAFFGPIFADEDFIDRAPPIPPPHAAAAMTSVPPSPPMSPSSPPKEAANDEDSSSSDNGAVDAALRDHSQQPGLDEARKALGLEGLDYGEEELSRALEEALNARAGRSVGRALRRVAPTTRPHGRYADSEAEAAFDEWKRPRERRACSAAAKGALLILLVWAVYEGCLASVRPSNTAFFWAPWHYALLAAAAGGVALGFAALADLQSAWEWLERAGYSRRLTTTVHVVLIGLTAEALLQRNASVLTEATPLFAMLVPLAAYSGALPSAWAALATLLCFLILQGCYLLFGFQQSWFQSAVLAPLWPLQPAFNLSPPALFICFLGLLACWQNAAAEAQQRLLFSLAAAVRKQDSRTSTILRAMLPAELVEAMASGAPALLFQPRATAVVARPMGLTGLLHATRAAQLTTRLVEAWEKAVEAHGLTPVRDAGDMLVAVCGAPRPVIRHAEKACQAALTAVKAIERLSEDVGAPLALRCGIYSGSAVSGAAGGACAAFAVWGDAMMQADRLQRLAPLNGVVASEATLDAIRALRHESRFVQAAHFKFEEVEHGEQADELGEATCYLVRDAHE